MSRGSKPSTELENLAAGLGQAEDPYMIAELGQLSIAELADMARKELRYTAVSMIRVGRVFMAIKKKLGHGEWEDFVIEQHWSWSYVRASMKLLEVVARFPQAMHLPPGRVIDRMLHLPMPEIAAVLEDLPTKAIEKLTPWDIESIYDKKKLENSRAKPKKKIDTTLPPENTDEQWMKVKERWAAAVVALENLVGACRLVKEWKTEYVQEALEKKMVIKLGDPWDDVVKFLHPIEEIRKLGMAED